MENLTGRRPSDYAGLELPLVTFGFSKIAQIQTSDTGDYWNKFASMAGKLYLLKNRPRMKELYNEGWQGFAAKIP